MEFICSTRVLQINYIICAGFSTAIHLYVYVCAQHEGPRVHDICFLAVGNTVCRGTVDLPNPKTRAADCVTPVDRFGRMAKAFKEDDGCDSVLCCSKVSKKTKR